MVSPLLQLHTESNSIGSVLSLCTVQHMGYHQVIQEHCIGPIFCSVHISATKLIILNYEKILYSAPFIFCKCSMSCSCRIKFWLKSMAENFTCRGALSVCFVAGFMIT